MTKDERVLTLQALAFFEKSRDLSDEIEGTVRDLYNSNAPDTYARFVALFLELRMRTAYFAGEVQGAILTGVLK